MLEVWLRPSFRYVHEPLSAGESVLPSLGNEAVSAELQSRLLHSRGGTFLISGFRGVGKSTLVLQALDQLVAASPPSDIVLPVWLSVARSTTTERLLFAVVRRIFEGLADLAVLDRLSAETRHALLVAYMRTSLSFRETQSEVRERSAGLDASGKGAVPIVNLPLPKLSMSAKRSHALATEAAFLAYSETDAEYDLMRIVSSVGKEPLTPPASRSRRRLFGLRPPGGGRYRTGRLRLIIVLDEVDKLTAGESGLKLVEDLLGGVKNVLTMSGAHFLIVAGPDMHDRAARDAARGNGVYESIFGWRIYVPCLWDAPDRLIEDVVVPVTSVSFEQLEPFIQYLRFKARGIPRRLLQEFNSYVVWVKNSPVLRINDADMERVEFYARLEGIMREHFERSGQTRLFPVPIDEDRWRLAGYYVVDWVLRSEGEPFSAADLLRGGDDADFDPLLRISQKGVARLLDHLADRGVLDVVREFSASSTIIADVGESGAKVYRLAEDIRLALFGLAVQYETERASPDLSIPVAAPAAVFPSDTGPGSTTGLRLDDAQSWTSDVPLQPPPIRVLNGRYELSRLLGQGGMGSVYAGQDRFSGQPVAVKLLRLSLSDDPQAVRRARREAELAVRLSHPQLVRTLDVIDDPDGSPALVMELLDGPTLSHRIIDDGPMHPSDAIDVGMPLADALSYLADQGIARIDLKPSNIIIQPGRGPVIIDLGVARDLQASNLTAARYVIGTPMYMAPELIRGNTPDPRADIYSLGLVLYYCLAGRNPWQHIGDMDAIMLAIMQQQVDVSVLPISEELRQVIAHATERDPNSRFQTAGEIRKALMATPEWRSPRL